MTPRWRRVGLARIRYRLADPAFSSASAVVTLAVRSSAEATLWSTRVPGVQAGSRGDVSFGCDLPAGRYVVVARGYDVAGNRQATAARAVLRVTASPARTVARAHR